VNLELVGRGLPERPRVPESLTPDARVQPTSSSRQAWFGAEHGWLETPVIARGQIGEGIAGPCIVEEYDATCVLPPGANAHLDAYGNIDISL
jgi:N-methylhydantoinase A